MDFCHWYYLLTCFQVSQSSRRSKWRQQMETITAAHTTVSCDRRAVAIQVFCFTSCARCSRVDCWIGCNTIYWHDLWHCTHTLFRYKFSLFLFFLFLDGAMITLVTRQIAIITCNLYRKCRLVCKLSLTTKPAVVQLAKMWHKTETENVAFKIKLCLVTAINMIQKVQVLNWRQIFSIFGLCHTFHFLTICQPVGKYSFSSWPVVTRLSLGLCDFMIKHSCLIPKCSKELYLGHKPQCQGSSVFHLILQHNTSKMSDKLASCGCIMVRCNQWWDCSFKISNLLHINCYFS